VIPELAAGTNYLTALTAMVSEETGELYGIAKTGYTISGYAYDAAGENAVGETDTADNYEDKKIYIIWEADET
jgi:hypothetical protein